MSLFVIVLLILSVLYMLLIALGIMVQLEDPFRRCGLIESLDNIGIQCYTKFSNKILELVRIYMKSAIYLGFGFGRIIKIISAGFVGKWNS